MTFAREVERYEDMSATGKLSLFQQRDGDIIVVCERDDGYNYERCQIEFCNPGPGGGRSPRVIAALKSLMDAIELDNKEHPINT